MQFRHMSSMYEGQNEQARIHATNSQECQVGIIVANGVSIQLPRKHKSEPKPEEKRFEESTRQTWKQEGFFWCLDSDARRFLLMPNDVERVQNATTQCYML